MVDVADKIESILNDLSEEEQLQAFLRLKHNFVTEAQKNPTYGFNKPLGQFVDLMSVLSPQSYGPRIQNRLIKELGLSPLKASDNQGDAINPTENICYEMKVSIISASNKCLNLVQIRLWQNVNYICLYYDSSSKKIEVFELTHEQMVKECDLLGSSAHGTKQANEHNRNKEIRFSLKIDEKDEDYRRWKKLYKSNILNHLI